MGTGGEPDFILISPRDRQVFESSVFPFEKNDTFAKGVVPPGYSLSIGGEDISVNSSGNFNAPINIKNLQEGQNNISISVSGGHNISFVRSFIGAYKYTNHNKSNAFVLRRGDFLFSDKRIDGFIPALKNLDFLRNLMNVTVSTSGLPNVFAFDAIPLEPDHAGLYVGDKQVADALWGMLRRTNLGWSKGEGNFYIDDLQYVGQVPKIAAESTRAQVAQRATEKTNDSSVNSKYDFPFLHGKSLLGHYDGPYNGFYCSEISYWSWQNVLGPDFCIPIEDVMYPFRGENNPSINSILPAYLCEKTMKVKEVAK